jgi:hypothetical protein
MNKAAAKFVLCFENDVRRGMAVEVALSCKRKERPDKPRCVG